MPSVPFRTLDDVVDVLAAEARFQQLNDRRAVFPSRHPPVVEACRRLEQGSSWATLLVAAARAAN